MPRPETNPYVLQLARRGRSITKLPPGKATPTDAFVEKFKPQLNLSRRLHLYIHG